MGGCGERQALRQETFLYLGKSIYFAVLQLSSAYIGKCVKDRDCNSNYLKVVLNDILIC